MKNEIDDNDGEAAVVADSLHKEIGGDSVGAIPNFGREIFPSNQVLSASDIGELSQLAFTLNESAKNIELRHLDISEYENEEAARKWLNDVVCVEYAYTVQNGDRVQGIGIPDINNHGFPDDIIKFFLTNKTSSERLVGKHMLNTFEIFLDFQKPTLKLDFLTLPSNPTSNLSSIGIAGRDEGWVISSEDKVRKFLKSKSAFYPVIHNSGAYDYILYFLYIPITIWLYYSFSESIFFEWTSGKSVFVSVILGIYGFFLPILFFRLLFQYIRWLFPPMEYYKKNRFGAYFHRALLIALIGSLSFAALYDILKGLILSIRGGA